MPITFKTSAHANITMLGDVGVKMLEMMESRRWILPVSVEVSPRRYTAII